MEIINREAIGLTTTREAVGSAERIMEEAKRPKTSVVQECVGFVREYQPVSLGGEKPFLPKTAYLDYRGRPLSVEAIRAREERLKTS